MCLAAVIPLSEAPCSLARINILFLGVTAACAAVPELAIACLSAIANKTTKLCK